MNTNNTISADRVVFALCFIGLVVYLIIEFGVLA